MRPFPRPRTTYRHRGDGRRSPIDLASAKDLRRLTSGPGRLCAAFCITRSRDNGADLTSPEGTLWIGDDGYQPGRIATSPRIGITKAAENPLRYFLTGNSYVSGPKSSSGLTAGCRLSPGLDRPEALLQAAFGLKSSFCLGRRCEEKFRNPGSVANSQK